MSEIDHTNSLDPDQAQQNGERSVRFKKCLGQKTTTKKHLQRYSAYSPLLYLEHDDTCWVYDATYDHLAVYSKLHYRPRICPANSRFMCVSNALYVR